MNAFLSGMGVGASLIIAIGAQNAFVLAQGLRKNHHISVAFLCAMCDAVLIIIGVMGLGAFIAQSPLLIEVMRWGGAAFLVWYGYKNFKNLFTDHQLSKKNLDHTNKNKVLVTTLAITLLNPHVYLDTVVLLGGISLQFNDDLRPLFACGAISASFIWFFTISLGAAWASPYLARPITWKIIDASAAVVMWYVALSLILKN